jgi:hypothetical protein
MSTSITVIGIDYQRQDALTSLEKIDKTQEDALESDQAIYHLQTWHAHRFDLDRKSLPVTR